MGATENFIGLIQRINDSFIRDYVYMVDRNLLAKAIKNIDSQYQDKILRNMTEDGAVDVKRLMEGIDASNVQQIEAAQQEILSLASQVI